MHRLPFRSLQSFLKPASLVVGAAVFASACGLSGPSRARLLSIEYRPDNTTEATRDVIFTYFESGFLDKVEVEVDGDEVEETLFNHEDDRLSSTEQTQKGNGSFTLITTFVLDGDEVSSLELEFSGSVPVDTGGDLALEGGGESTFERDDSGRITSVETNLDYTGRHTFEVGGQEIDYRTEYDSSTTESLVWDDDVLSTRSSENEEVTKEFLDDVENSTTREQTDDDIAYTYDEGVLTEVEQERVYSTGEDDYRTEATLEAEFNEDGQLRELTGTEKYGETEVDAEVDVTYDESGRISRIEDQDGNRWSFDYEDDEETQGVTLYSNVLPAFIDLEGRQVMEAVSLTNHLGF